MSAEAEKIEEARKFRIKFSVDYYKKYKRYPHPEVLMYHFHQHRLSLMTDEEIKEMADKFYSNYGIINRCGQDTYSYAAKAIIERLKSNNK